ncbi:UDP-N-acetylmuramoyl-L-alanine--D-glutamate ligase [Microvirga mediterraneensis]|uniref:UDP-N-acetylmuramoylalanine--D-glutamate ligase n=1 Tax=Microvirga mediterraneensis TaxID=2754695 RepID=A0A838BML6_9HYPH|nr:UDP-N-acetylmuramoyl-L-alanine--D-glutamate ligase [Microvirga mediterraneensis]MBA1156335.1 UDP-N-acetylmuramoyl-L-alanine--D-glutamate ligase [Microvirga mediterraneensis]
MIPVTTFAGKTVALFGLGGSGLATALALKAGGAHVVACDDNPAKMAEAGAKGIETADLREADWSRFSSFILSPGVPLTHPEPHWSARLARQAGVEIIGDIELFCRERAKIAPNAPFVAITGTNGKSTTTALIAHILREAGRDVQMGGNIGTAILSLEPPSDTRIHVIECSSFQIDLTPSLAPTIGVHLNLSPDHIDRHGTMELYAAIKERLVAKAGLAVIGIDDAMSRAIAEACEGRGVNVARVSVEPIGAKGVFADGETLVGVTDSDTAPLADLAGIGALRGAHNAQNAAAAVAVALALDVSLEKIRSGLGTFPGLPHRMEEVGRIGHALFINDSKATNADSTEKALKSFDDIFWILGGKAKEGGIEPLESYFPKIRKAYLIGAAADEFSRTLGSDVAHVLSGTLDRAVEQAAADALAMGGPAVVLLSPACASYDQFPNYEVRGNHFRDLVRALPGIEAKGA